MHRNIPLSHDINQWSGHFNPPRACNNEVLIACSQPEPRDKSQSLSWGWDEVVTKSNRQGSLSCITPSENTNFACHVIWVSRVNAWIYYLWKTHSTHLTCGPAQQKYSRTHTSSWPSRITETAYYVGLPRITKFRSNIVFRKKSKKQ